MKNDALFCVGQKAFIEKDGRVLVLFDEDKGEIDFPGGKIQEGEARVGDPQSLTDALKREVREETGFEIEVREPFVVWYYEFSPHHSRNAGKVVYLVGFRCELISGDLTLSTEHRDYRWVSKLDYQDLDDGSDYFGALKKYFEFK